MDIKEILEKLGKDVLNEDSRAAISEAFQTAVDAQVTERLNEKVELEVTTALAAQDDEHTKKLHELVEAIDVDHSKKFVEAIKAYDLDKAGKLQAVVEKYENTLKHNAKEFRDALVNKVSTFVDLKLEKAIPSSQISEAVRNTRSRKLVDEIKKIVSVDEEFVTENVREALDDGKQIMERQKKDLNETLKENIRISKELKSANAKILLSEKTSGFMDKKQAYVQKVLENKSPEYIEANFQYVVEMFEREDAEAAEILTEEARGQSVSNDVVIPESMVKDEVTPIVESSDSVGGYLNVLEKQDRKSN